MTEIELDEEVIDRLKDTTKADLFKDIIKPDLSRVVRMQLVDDKGNVLDDTPLFTKELKVSNLNDFQLWYVVELTDLAQTVYKYGAINAAKAILTYRDALLSAAPSRRALLLKLMNTEYHFRRIETEEKKARKWLSRGENEYV